MKKNPVGRPKIPKKERKSVIYPIRLSEDLKMKLEKKAEGEGKGLAEWIRELLLKALG